MSGIRYLCVYSGPSYGSWGLEFMAGVKSLNEAWCYFSDFQSGYVHSVTYRENGDGNYVPWESEYSVTPATTFEDTMDVYRVTGNNDGSCVRHPEPSFRLYLGERGGIKRESY